MTGERQLIKKIKEWTGASRIGDDCAVLPGGGLVSSDMLVEGRHFDLAYFDYESLGWKSCAVNLSDIAAMGGRPRFLTVSLSLPGYVGDRDLQSFYKGFNDCARAYRAEVVGGDLTGGEAFVISVTVMGEAHEQGVLLRSGAKPGDVVVVTGAFGGSALGLRDLQAEPSRGNARANAAVERHLRPIPRFEAAHAFAAVCAGRGALMDTSDGLADALYQICEASHVSMNIDCKRIPLEAELSRLSLSSTAATEPDLRKLGPALALGLYGGEDYELVGCLDRALFDSRPDLPFVAVGEVVAQKKAQGPQVRLSGMACELKMGLDEAEKGETLVDLNNCYRHFW